MCSPELREQNSKIYKERNEKIRSKFIKLVDALDQNKIYDFDESGIDLEISCEYGFAKKGKRLEIPRSGRRGKRFNILAARNSN